jgi:hypothetical protein
MISSFKKYLERHYNCGISLVNWYKFGKLRAVLKCKQNDLKTKAVAINQKQQTQSIMTN